MIEVKINLIPFGMRERERQIGFVKIWNDGTGTLEVGNYKYEIHDDHDELIMTGEYKGFLRQDKTIFHLMKEILNKVLVE